MTTTNTTRSKNTPASPEEAALTAGVLSPRNGGLGTNCSIKSAKSKITPKASLWLQVNIFVAFLKAEKPASELGSYQPISLTSYMWLKSWKE